MLNGPAVWVSQEGGCSSCAHQWPFMLIKSNFGGAPKQLGEVKSSVLALVSETEVLLKIYG